MTPFSRQAALVMRVVVSLATLSWARQPVRSDHRTQARVMERERSWAVGHVGQVCAGCASLCLDD